MSRETRAADPQIEAHGETSNAIAKSNPRKEGSVRRVEWLAAVKNDEDQTCSRCGQVLPHDNGICEMSTSAVGQHGSEAPQDPLSGRATGANALKLGLGCLVLIIALMLTLWLAS